MKCPRCGRSISEQSRYCQECGFQIIGNNPRYFKTVQLRCKACGATMTIEPEGQQAICSFCGSKELIIEDTEVTVERIKSKTARELKDIDYKQLQEKNRVELEKLYYEENKKVRESERDWREIGRSVIIILGIFGVIIILAMLSRFSDKVSGKISLPSDPVSYLGENYHAVEMELEDSGFTNITLKPLEDLDNNSKEKDGVVYKIMIDGKTDWFPSTAKPDVQIIVYYHSLELAE